MLMLKEIVRCYERRTGWIAGEEPGKPRETRKRAVTFFRIGIGEGALRRRSRDKRKSLAPKTHW